MNATASSINPPPLIISGYSSQPLAEQIASALGSRTVKVTHRQYDDEETETTIQENVRGRKIAVVASAAGAPDKQISETRSLMRDVAHAGAAHIMLLLPYMFYGRSDKNLSMRRSPKLFQVIEDLRAGCDSAVVCDPHNHEVTYAKFNDSGGRAQHCVIAHFAFPYAAQLQSLMQTTAIDHKNLVFAHADAGSGKRIDPSFRECMYDMLGFTGRNPDQDDWAQGLKDRDKKTNKSRIKGFSGGIKGKHVVIFEDMISSGGTACDLAALLKQKGAHSTILFATSGLFTTKRFEEPETRAIERINTSRLDAVFITDTYDFRNTRPPLADAIEQSPIIHSIETAPYLALILHAMHIEAHEPATNENSVSAILRGKHPAQLEPGQTIAQPTPLKPGNPLLRFQR